MFKHILLPVDGSTLSEEAVRKGVRLAGALGARVTAFHVAPRAPAMAMMAESFESDRGESEGAVGARAGEILRFARKAANTAGVDCEATFAHGEEPCREIIRAAEHFGCDLIVMASHARRGLEGVLLGSETRKVLTSSRIPVLVYR